MESVGIAALVVALLVLLAVVGNRLNEIEQRVCPLYRIEAKLDFLLEQAHLEFDPYANLPREVVEAVQRGQKVKAIKLYRQTTGLRLKAAKDFIEEVQRRAGVV
jgi:hypothetical protein